MAIKIQTTITDDAGNEVIFSQHYQEENTLLDKNVDEIEVLIMKAKKDMGKLAELELLRLNQSDYTKKKSIRLLP
jgi:hypothetical protein